MRGQSWQVTLLEAEMDAIVKTRDALEAQRRVATLMEQAMRTSRLERRGQRQARGR